MLAVVLTAASVLLCIALTGVSLICRCYFFFVHSCHASTTYRTNAITWILAVVMYKEWQHLCLSCLVCARDACQLQYVAERAQLVTNPTAV
jgi:hypothetical protein